MMANRKEIREAARKRDIATLNEAIKIMARHIPPVGSVQPMARIPWREAIKLMRQMKAELESEVSER